MPLDLLGDIPIVLLRSIWPYQLPAGPIHHLDSFIALATFADGSCRLGESTALPLHGHETPEHLASEYGLLARHGQLHAFLDRNRFHHHITLPILTCLDPTLARPLDGQVALCPLLTWNHPAEIAGRVAELAGLGNKTAKVNLPSNLVEAEKILRETIRAGEQCGVRFRYDAQGTLDFKNAEIIVGLLDDSSTELLEQPFPAEAWEKMGALYALSAHSPYAR